MEEMSCESQTILSVTTIPKKELAKNPLYQVPSLPKTTPTLTKPFGQL